MTAGDILFSTTTRTTPMRILHSVDREFVSSCKTCLVLAGNDEAHLVKHTPANA